jgi:ATP-dependent DNA helicase RecG
LDGKAFAYVLWGVSDTDRLIVEHASLQRVRRLETKKLRTGYSGFFPPK